VNAQNEWIGDSELGERFPRWTRGNAAGVFPDPFRSFGKSLVLRESVSPGLRDVYIEPGLLKYDELESPEAPDLFTMFGGDVDNPLTMTPVLGPGALGAACEALGDPTLSIRLLPGAEIDSGDSSQATWHPRPILPGSRCSCRPPASWSTSERWAATR